MLDINGGEFVVLAVVALVVLGPERLPEYASQLARLVKDVRRIARNARDQVREEMGPEFDDVDWQALDPRRYDPRRIVREALLDDDAPSGHRAAQDAPYVPEPMRDGSGGPAGQESAGAGQRYDADAT